MAFRLPFKISLFVQKTFELAHFRYFNIQPKTIDIATRLRGMNPTDSIFYFPDLRTEVYSFRLNFNISKLGYSVISYPSVFFTDLRKFSKCH